MAEHDWTYYALIGGGIALALFIRLRRLGRTERLRLGALWIIPTIFTLLAAMVFWQYPPSGLGWLWVATGFAAGCMIGWWRARYVAIGVDPESGRLTQRSSAGALIVLGAIMLVRWLLRSVVMVGDAHWHLGAMLISDIFIAMAVGALSFYRIEIYIRARRLLGDMDRDS